MSEADLRDALTQYVFDPGAFQDPHPLLRSVRALGPVAQTTAGPWAVLGYEANERLLGDRTFSRAASAAVECDAIAGDTEAGKAAAEVFRRWFFNMDAPDHTRLRRLASPAFRPSVIAELEERVLSVASMLTDRLIDSGECDFLSRFAYDLPHLVICEMLGVPASDHAQWGRWLHTIMEGNKTTLDDGVADLRDALLAFGEYCRDLIRARYDDPGSGLVGSLVSAGSEGDAMTEDELVSTLTLLVIAGHDTTVHLLASGVACLLTSGQWPILQSRPELAPQAVEECLRFEPSARIRPRTTVAATTLAGVSLPAGAVVQPLVAAANRDPDRFDDPDVFDITRARPSHLTLGFGPHYCIGASIARREAILAFEVLATRVDLELRDDLRWRHAAHRNLERLNVAAQVKQSG